ncbi:MAG TPA: peptide deformylase [Thermodesulfobacteriota bacterium]|nr:peptide deformylase [Thermodesulfobacteriota bacterium]
MALRKILTYPDPFLRKKCAPVEEIDGEVLELLDDMAETMYGARGVGLAASQIGVDKRVVVIDISPRNTRADEEGEGEDEEEEEERTEYEGPGLIELINPEIISSEGEVIAEEACLSIPGFTSDVKRKQRVVIEAYDREGQLIEIEASELLARVFQHEIDHINGILFIDRLSRLKRELIKRKIEKELGKEEKRYAVL